MKYVILEKSRVKHFVRTRKGKLEQVKEHERKGEKKKPKTDDLRVRKIDTALAKEESERLELIFKNIQKALTKKLKKLAPHMKIKWGFNHGNFSDWEERYSQFKMWVPTSTISIFPWIDWELVPKKPKGWEYSSRQTASEEKFRRDWMGRGSISFTPKSLEPDWKIHETMSFTVGDSDFGDKLKNKGLYTAILSVIADARDKGWIENRFHVHMGLGTKAWNKLAKKFNFPYVGNEKK